MIQSWKDDDPSGRSKTAAALDELRKAIGSKTGKDPHHRSLFEQLQAALGEVERAAPLHNPELAQAVYQRVVQLAVEASASRTTR